MDHQWTVGMLLSLHFKHPAALGNVLQVSDGYIPFSNAILHYTLCMLVISKFKSCYTANQRTNKTLTKMTNNAQYYE